MSDFSFHSKNDEEKTITLNLQFFFDDCIAATSRKNQRTQDSRTITKKITKTIVFGIKNRPCEKRPFFPFRLPFLSLSSPFSFPFLFLLLSLFLSFSFLFLSFSFPIPGRSTSASLSEDELHVSWQAQHWTRPSSFCMTRAQHFEGVL